MKKLFAICYILTAVCVANVAIAADAQNAWNNPNANMAAGSSKPGYAQLTWTPGAVLPIKLRLGMVTMINMPAGETIADGVVGNDQLFKIDPQKGTMYITPVSGNQGGDTNLVVTGKSGNKYIFYLKTEPANSPEITYSQVDVTTDGAPIAAGAGTQQNGTANMNSIFAGQAADAKTSTTGVDGTDYSWIKSMKIDPSQFRFDLDIFVPNPDDYVIAPERVWRDEIFTYIDFGDKVIAMTQRPVVSLLVEGGESPVGFRTDGENGRLMIVEAVGDMVLRSGQRIVCIKRRAKPFLIADTQSVMALAESNVAASAYSTQSLNNVGYNNAPMPAAATNTVGTNGAAYNYGAYGIQMAPQAIPTNTGATAGGSMANQIPAVRNTAGAYLPGSDIPVIPSNQKGVAVELQSDTSVKALNDYWTKLLAQFSGDDGAGILTPYRDKVFFAVDDSGVGALGGSSAASRLYRLRIGPLADIDTAQTLCNQLQKFQSVECNVVRIQ